MKLNIPDIGTDLVLSKDWILKLYPERRNDSLGEHFNYFRSGVNHEGKWKDFWCQNKTSNEIRESMFEGLRNRPEQYSNNYSHNRHSYLIETKDYKNWEIEREICIQKFLNNNLIIPVLELTIPEGSILKVDRIYIRKGSSDFSSLSFWLKLPNEKKKFRFWSKLENVNEIEFN